MNTNNNNEINNNKKGSTKGKKIDGKYIPSKEQKSQYLQTYKNTVNQNSVFVIIL
jgi:hypothetical protein